MNVLCFFFIFYCLSLYRVEMWYGYLGNLKQYRRRQVIYHKSIKQMCCKKPRDVNHLICTNMSLDTFKHLFVMRCYTFFLLIVTSETRSLRILNNNSESILDIYVTWNVLLETISALMTVYGTTWMEWI